MKLISFVHLCGILLVASSCQPSRSPSVESNEAEANVTEAPSGNYEEFAAMANIPGTEIPVKFYPLLGLDTGGYARVNHYTTQAKVEIPWGTDFFVCAQNAGCDPIGCIWYFLFIPAQPNHVADGARIDLHVGQTPSFTHLHHLLLVYSETTHNYSENESGAMEEEGDPFDVYCCVFLNGLTATLVSSQMSKEDLRLARNSIFADYGLRFKSPDLQQYFSSFSWYHPASDNVDSQLTDVDKAIIRLIQDLEGGH